MARGWESKSIEAQQEEAARARTPKRPLTVEERAQAERRKAVELARTRVADELARATAPAHRTMLEKALAALDEQLGGRPDLP
jgi:hypothetical protein